MFRLLLILAFASVFVSCNGGGGGDGNVGSQAGLEAPTLVSGSVQAPSGQIAFIQRSSILDQLASLFVSTSHAALSGLNTVPDGAVVQLIRLSPDGIVFSILATTATSGGNYSFNLTDLSLSYAHDLLVRVSGSGGVVLRAFAIGPNIDVSPISEAAVQLVLQQLGGSSVSQLTSQEVSDIQGAVTLLVTLQSLGAVSTVNQAVNTVKGVVAANPTVMSFITAASLPGQTTQGVGDIGNYFPMSQGNAWHYQSSADQGQSQYRNSLIVHGTRLLGNVTTTVLSESNPDSTSLPEDDYFVKDAQSLTFHGSSDNTDTVTPQLTPYPLLRFPLSPGLPVTQVKKVGLDYGQDVDGDGTNETVDVSSEISVVSLETVSVPAGTFLNAARVTTTTIVALTVSSDRSKLTATNTETIWYAPGVGPVKRTSVTQGGTTPEAIFEQLTSYASDGTVSGGLPGVIIQTGPRNASVSPGRPDVASNGTDHLLVACQTVASSPGIVAVLISTTGRIMKQIPVASIDCLHAADGRPAVAFDGTNYLVVYNENNQIRGVRISQAGVVLDTNGFLISTTVVPLFFQRCCADVAFDGSHYLVVWSSGPSGGRVDIAGARVTPAGQSLGEFSLTAAAPGDHVVPSVVFDGTNYFVVWMDTRQSHDNTDIYGTRVAPDGTILDPQGIAIATTSRPEREARLAFDGSQYFVVWTAALAGGVGYEPTEIRGARLLKDGTLLDGPSGVGGIGVNTTSASKIVPTVAWDGASFVVAWQLVNHSTALANGSIAGTRVSPAGQVAPNQPTIDGFMFSDTPTTNAFYYLPSLYSSGGRSILAWAGGFEHSGLGQVFGTLSIP